VESEVTKKIPLLIDTDPGVDDALAILMALNDANHDVVGLSIAAGNVGLECTVRNALKLCEVAGRNDISVFAGCTSPLVFAPREDAAHVHGRDGFGDAGFAPPARQAEAEHAALAILRLSREHAGELLLVALGPLTNIALALKLDSTLPSRIRRFVVMGGAVNAHGNITPVAEFNIGFDPEAAHMVFDAFPTFDLCDWQATLAHGFHHQKVECWLQADSPCARFYDQISLKTRNWSADRRGEFWHSADALAMAWALQPEGALEMTTRPLQVETAGHLTRGMTVIDWNRQTRRADNANLLLRYDQARFEGMAEAALAAR
jgi:purine nucleosidase